jgi:hypothetical protein
MKLKVIAILNITPPLKSSSPTEENIEKLTRWLTSINEKYPEKGFFYEALDKYLGPFGEDGYFIGHGQKYTVAFYSHPELQGHPATKEWVEKSMSSMQNLIVEYLLTQFTNERLEEVTGDEVARVTLQASAEIFHKSGMSRIRKESPLLARHIIGIMKNEFKPTSLKSIRSYKQFGVMMWRCFGYMAFGPKS